MALDTQKRKQVVYFVGDEIVVAKSYSEIVNYENLKKEGWSYSKINSKDPIVSQEDFAIYKTNFTRFNNQDIELISTDTNLTLIKRGDYWKLKSKLHGVKFDSCNRSDLVDTPFENKGYN